MHLSSRHFSIELYSEHLEEAAFLAEQRYTLQEDIELQWTDLESYETRWEAHIDALLLGDNLALGECRNRLASGDDPWETHAALVVMCRHGLGTEIFEFVEQLDDDDELVLIVARALRHEIPSRWQTRLLKRLSGATGACRAVLLQIAAYRRFPIGDVCVDLVTSGSRARIHALWALSRVGGKQHINSIQLLPDLEDVDLKLQHALTRLRLGDTSVVDQLLEIAQFSSWPMRCLGLFGAQRAVNLLIDQANGDQCTNDTVIALGQLGDLSAVKVLVALLEQENLAEAAAIALNLITGASLYQEVFIEEQFESGDLFNEELVKFQQEGKLPTRSDGQPFGNWEHRPTTDATVWHEWLKVHRTAFIRSHRWRLGKPFSPLALVESLHCSAVPLRVRSLLYDELVCRYQMPIPFEHDLPVKQQQVFLQKMSAWATLVEANYRPGIWYFACEEIN